MGEGDPTSVDSKVSLVGLKQGATLSGQVEVSASAGAGAPGVDFYVNDKRVVTVLSMPYKTILDTKAFADGSATIAVASAGSKTGLSEVKVTFDNTGPDVKLVDPKPGDVFYGGGDMVLHFDATDPAGIKDLKVKANGISLPVQGPPYQATFNLSAIAAAMEDLPLELQVRVEATDGHFVASTKTFALKLASRLAWKYGTLGEIWAPPVFGAKGTAYFGSRDGTVYAIGSTGTLLWTYKTGKEIVVSPALDPLGPGDHIWISAGDELLMLDEQGKLVGETFTAPNTLGTSPVVGEDAVYVGTFGGALVALYRATHAVKWTFTAGEAIESTPVLLPNGLLVFGCDDRYVHAVDATGAPAWKVETGGKVWSNPAATKSGDILIGSHDGYVYRIGKDGTKLWEFDARGQVWGGATEGPGGEIYVGSTYRRLYRLDAKGTKKWEHEFSGLAYATAAVSKSGVVYVASTDGTIHALQPDGQELWNFVTGGELTGSVRLSPDESILAVGTNDRHMYALRIGSSGP